jgi:membrane associated rhomboid family serine protease
LLSLGPQVQQTLRMTTGNRWPLWPLLAGAALSGSIFFLLFSQSGCLGLSSVTLGLLAVYARFFPDRTMGVVLAGIFPVRMPAERLLTVLLVWSAVGSLLHRRSGVAHAAHLGGLLFGCGYYELWQHRYQLQAVLHSVEAAWKKNR